MWLTDLKTDLPYSLSARSFYVDGIEQAGLLGQGWMDGTELPGIFPKKIW